MDDWRITHGALVKQVDAELIAFGFLAPVARLGVLVIVDTWLKDFIPVGLPAGP